MTAELHPRDPAAAVRLTVAFAPGEEIGGTVIRDEGETRPFTGWMGLVAAIESLAGDSTAPLAGTIRPLQGAGAPAALLELEQGHARFTGDGESFSGWLGLVRRVQSLLAASDDPRSREGAEFV
jgi:hypothetical protein